MNDPAQVLRKLIDARRSSSAGLNEAATRLQIVDTMLTEVLGWPKESLHPEDPTSDPTAADRRKTTWIDYHLKHPSTPQRLVVEAKRVGVTFSLSKTKKRSPLPLGGLLRNHGEQLRDAVQQARNYCINTGTDAFVVTNGEAWIGSIAFAHTIALEDIQAVVFDSLDEIYNNLPRFQDLFGPPGIASRTLAREAMGRAFVVPAFAQRLNEGKAQTQSAEKNYLMAPLQMLMTLCFGDLTDSQHREMLAACYVATDASSAGLRSVEAFVGANLPMGLENSEKLNRASQTPNPFPAPTGVRGGTVLLAGRAGSGKSTFLAHLKMRLSTQFNECRHLILHCDLLDKTEIHARNFDHDRFVDDVADELLHRAEREFLELSPYTHENLQQIFAGEVRRRELSMEPALRGTEFAVKEREALIQRHVSKPLSHLKAYLGFLDRSDFTTTVLLDNVDRGTEEFERVTFQLAESLGRNSRTTVVVSVRDTTIEAGRRLSFLDVRQSPVVALTAPPFLEVAARRFEYTKNRLSADSPLWRKFSGSLGGHQPARVLDFAEILAELVLTEDSGVADAITAISGTNMRRALHLLAEFSTSPWTDLNSAFRSYQDGKRLERLSLRDFLRSVMRRDKRRYIEDESAELLNLFRADAGRVVSHFICVRLLQFLHWNSRALTKKDVPMPDVLAVFSGIGYPSNDVLNSIERMGRLGLIGSLSRAEPPWDEGDQIRIGAAGEYYIQRLIFDREYLFNVLDDTVVYDSEVFSSLSRIDGDTGMTAVRRQEERLLVFLRYIRRHELEELQRLGSYKQRLPWIVEVSSTAIVRTLGRAALADQPAST